MKRFLVAAVTCVVACGALLALSGCSMATSAETRAAKPTGVWGFVASSKSASITVDPTRASTVGVQLPRVVAPADALILVTENDSGMPVGVASVKRGQNTDVKIPLSGVMMPGVTFTMYLDRGRKGILDVDMMKPATSADRPIFVDGGQLSVSATLWQSGQPSQPGSATLDVFDQIETSGTLLVSHLIAPGPSWITVSTDASGFPGQLIGTATVSATDTVDVPVPISNSTYRGRVWVALHADAGVPSLLEYDRFGPLASSPDQIYTVNGKELLVGITLR